MGTVHGEDLPYVFGAPLVDGFSHFPRNYTKSEVALSEALMIFWSNFARTGNPNEHHRQDPVLLASKERNRFRSIVWDEYDPVHQKYLEIGKKLDFYIVCQCANVGKKCRYETKNEKSFSSSSTFDLATFNTRTTSSWNGRRYCASQFI